MRVLRIPGHVHYGEGPGGGTILLNTRTGQWHVINGSARELWEECRRTGDFDAAVAVSAGRVPAAHAQRLRRDAEVLAEALLDRGLLTSGRSGRTVFPKSRREPAARNRGQAAERIPPAGGPPPTGSPAQAPEARFRLRRRDRIAGLLGLALALCLLWLSFRAVLRTVSVVKRLLGPRPATGAQAERAVQAVERAAGHYPGRVACLELSLGAVMTLALVGRSVDWCLGNAGHTMRLHAWIEVGRAAVPHPQELDGEGSFREILRV